MWTSQKNTRVFTQVFLLALALANVFGYIFLASGDSIPLSSVITKLQAIHEDAKSLLIKNAELRAKILAGLQEQNEAKMKQTKESPKLLIGLQATKQQIADKHTTNQTTTTTIKPPVTSAAVTVQPTKPATTSTTNSPNSHYHKKPLVLHPNHSEDEGDDDDAEDSDTIDFEELQEFNSWVESSLEYAVENTEASAEALKEEASHNNGMVDYTEQAIKDGIEGVKYWQSAVIFQDKTLKGEKFDPVTDGAP